MRLGTWAASSCRLFSYFCLVGRLTLLVYSCVFLPDEKVQCSEILTTKFECFLLEETLVCDVYGLLTQRTAATVRMRPQS